jgi:hypothetical protein
MSVSRSLHQLVSDVRLQTLAQTKLKCPFAGICIRQCDDVRLQLSARDLLPDVRLQVTACGVPNCK